MEKALFSSYTKYMKFNNDIFISYAHIDNQPLIKGSEGWVSQFHHALEVRVDQLRGIKSSVWRDLKLHGNDCFDDTIIDQLPNVAVLVSVLTPRYVHSDWCTKELDEFCNASIKTGGLRFEDKMRIFKILKTPVPIEEHPLNIRDVLGYEFFVINPDTGRARELNEVFGVDAEREFWVKLDDLAQDLCQLLDQLEYGKPAELLAANDKNTVFVASASYDIKEQYDSIRRDLLGQNIRVLPDRPLPLNTDELIPFLRETLAQCQLSIHPIGKQYGVIPEGAERSLIAIQNELAIEREEQGDFSRLVWIPPELEIEDVHQKQFVEALRSDPRIQFGGDLLETPLEDLKTQVYEILNAKPKASVEQITISPEMLKVSKSDFAVPLTETTPITTAIPRPNETIQSPIKDNDLDEFICIYLICDAPDLENITPVADCLFDLGYEVILPAFEGDEAEVREDHEDNLCRADAVLIYYATANELWLHRKLREVRKSAGLGRTEPLKANAILVSPPNSQSKKWLRSREAIVIHQPDDFSSELLAPFLTELKH